MPLTAFAVIALFSPPQEPRFGEIHRMLPRDTKGASLVLLGDVDGDLDLDLVGLCVGQDSLFLNVGDGRFEEATAGHLPIEDVEATAGALADIDGDGDLDLFRAHFLGETPSLCLGDGAGGFVEIGFPPSDLSFAEAALGDVDGDGDLDVVLAGATLPVSGKAFELFLGDGAGGFAEVAGWIPGEPNGAQWSTLALADLDGDGDLDLLVANSDPYGVLDEQLFLNLGDGHFVDASSTLPPGPGPTQDLALADLEDDGDLDVFVAGGMMDASRLWMNAGAAAFIDESTSLPPTPEVLTAIFLDADLDLDEDLLVGAIETGAGAYGHTLHLFEGDGSGGFANATALVGGDPDKTCRELTAGDVDTDGDTDVLAAPGVGLWLANGHGGFQESTGDIAAQAAPVLLADLDADGFTDALLVGREDSWSTYKLLLGELGGAFTPAHNQLPSPAYVDTICGVLGDVEGDGDLDAFWGNREYDRLWLNDGAASFSDATSGLPASILITSAAAFADLDGDGDLDLVTAEAPQSPSQPGQNRVLRNAGGGQFAVLAGAFPPISKRPYRLAVGDADGDGDLDVISRSAMFPMTSPGSDRLYLNSGSSLFAEAPGALPVLDGTGMLVWDDFDGDLVLELFVCGGSEGLDRYLESDGAGHFFDAGSGLPPGALGTRSAAACDMDEDGNLDLLLARKDTAALYLGNGMGSFTDESGGLPALGYVYDYYDHGVAVADLDADGDEDAWFPNQDNTSALFFNQRRGLAWRALPRIGKELVLDVSGPALEPWAVAFGTAVAPVDLPPYGTLYLSPTGLGLLGSGLLDDEGRGELVLQVPHLPALVGLTFYAQGLVGNSPRFTNPEAASFTDL